MPMTSRARRAGGVGDCGRESNRQRSLALGNRQHLRPVNLRLLRRIVQALLREAWPDGSFDLVISIVAAPEMTRLNEAFLRHQGSTDVITFDYAERAGQAAGLSLGSSQDHAQRDRQDARPALLHGEIFVCLDEAVSQARRFRTTWQSELVRYIVHGVLHLLGHDDLESCSRRRMKRTEGKLLRHLAHQFALRRLAAPGTKRFKLTNRPVPPPGHGRVTRDTHRILTGHTP